MLLIFLLSLCLPCQSLPSSFPNYDNPIQGIPHLTLPNTKSCTVDLFSFENTDYNTIHVKDYEGPCSIGPFSAVILTFEGAVRGVQFDRYGNMWINELSVLRFTTPEPSFDGIKWSVQKNVIEYLPTFLKSGTSSLSLPNVIDPTYTGIIYINASLTFYFDDSINEDEKETICTKSSCNSITILPLRSPVAIGISDPWSFMGVSSTNKQESQIQLTSIKGGVYTKAYLDIFASGHGCEEFWYTNPPGASTGGVCGNGAFRQIGISIDDVFAGAVFPFPVIYTGGVNPLLWRPLTGIESFDVPPYKFDITPFLSILQDGNSHSLKIWIEGNNESGVWYVDPVLRTYRSMNIRHLFNNRNGDISSNNGSPTVIVQNSLNKDGNPVYNTLSSVTYIISGVLKGITTNDENFEIHSSVSGSLSSINNNVVAVIALTNGAMTSSHESQAIILPNYRLFKNKIVNKYPYSIYLDQEQDSTSMQINATVKFALEREVSWSDNDAFTNTISWSNSMSSAAIYNRSLASHEDIYKQDESTSESFVMTLNDNSCYDRYLVAKTGSILSDSNPSGALCELPNQIYWNGGDLSFLIISGFDLSFHRDDRGGNKSDRFDGRHNRLFFCLIFGVVSIALISLLVVLRRRKSVNNQKEYLNPAQNDNSLLPTAILIHPPATLSNANANNYYHRI